MHLLPNSSARFHYHLGLLHSSFHAAAIVPGRNNSIANTHIPADATRQRHSYHGKSLSQKNIHPRGSNTTRAFGSSATALKFPSTPNDAHLASTSPEPFYAGPLAPAFHRVKLFSISSLGLAATLTPVIFIVEAPIPTSARAALALTAIIASGGSTALIAWCGAPYVQSIRYLAPPATSTGVAISTKSFWMKDLHTEVYDTAFLGQTTRAFAKWELAPLIRMQRDTVRQPGTQEVAARTKDRTGKVLGEWVIDWNVDDGKVENTKDHVLGKGHARGHIVRQVNIIRWCQRKGC